MNYVKAWCKELCLLTLHKLPTETGDVVDFQLQASLSISTSSRPVKMRKKKKTKLYYCHFVYKLLKIVYSFEIDFNLKIGNEVTRTACQRCPFAWLLHRERAHFRHSGVRQPRKIANILTEFTGRAVSSFSLVKLCRTSILRVSIKANEYH